MLRRRGKQGPIGLDISATSVKMIQFGGDGDRPEIVAAATQDLPSVKDSAAWAAATAKIVGEALRQQPFIGREVVTALGTHEFQIKNIRLPRMSDAELGSAVDFEARERFELPPDKAQIRFIPAGEVRHGNELKQEIIVFAASDELVLERLQLLESIKLRPVAIDITPCAMARSFIRFLRRTEDAQSVNVFLDVGWHGTSVVITRGTHVSFIKVIEVGGMHFNQAVSESLKIPMDEAARLRLSMIRSEAGGRESDEAVKPNEMQETVIDAVRPHLERLGREVHLCLRYFAVTFRGQRPESLTFVGGEAHQPRLVELVGEGMEIPCTIGHPLRGITHGDLLGGRDRRTYNPAWAVAAGLALRGSRWVQPRASRRVESSASPVGVGS